MTRKLTMKYLIFAALTTICSLSGGMGINTEDINFQNVLQEVRNINIQDHPDIKKWMTECEETVGKEHWRMIKRIPSQIYPCIRRYIKPAVIQAEIEDSIERGELDMVFKKYCGRKENILECLYEPLELVKPCLNNTDLLKLNTTEDAINAGADFVCSESGDKIALFMSEDGVECVRNHTEALKDCVRKEFPAVDTSKEDLMTMRFDHLLISEDNCRNLTSVHQCVVDVTSACEDPTPSNLIDSLLTQALKVTACHPQSSAAPKLGHFSSTLLHPYFLTLLMALLAALHVLL